MNKLNARIPEQTVMWGFFAICIWCFAFCVRVYSVWILQNVIQKTICKMQIEQIEKHMSIQEDKVLVIHIEF